MSTQKWCAIHFTTFQRQDMFGLTPKQCDDNPFDSGPNVAWLKGLAESINPKLPQTEVPFPRQWSWCERLWCDNKLVIGTEEFIVGGLDANAAQSIRPHPKQWGDQIIVLEGLIIFNSKKITILSTVTRWSKHGEFWMNLGQRHLTCHEIHPTGAPGRQDMVSITQRDIGCSVAFSLRILMVSSSVHQFISSCPFSASTQASLCMNVGGTTKIQNGQFQCSKRWETISLGGHRSSDIYPVLQNWLFYPWKSVTRSQLDVFVPVILSFFTKDLAVPGTFLMWRHSSPASMNEDASWFSSFLEAICFSDVQTLELVTWDHDWNTKCHWNFPLKGRVSWRFGSRL